jgi:hypothetical protein
MRRALLAAALAVSAYGSLPDGTTWEIRLSNGSDTNGGGFVTGASGTDYSQQNPPQVSYTDLTVQSTTTTFKSATYPPQAAYVGNIIQVTSGSGCTTGFFEITAVNTGTSVYTVDRSLGSSTDVCTAYLGGALKTLSKMITAMETTGSIYQTSWVKAESAYSTSSQLNYAASGTNAGVGSIVGYSSTRGDNGQFTITASTTSSTTWLLLSNGVNIQNAIVNCSSLTSSTGIEADQGSSQAMSHLNNVEVENCTTYAFNFQSPAFCMDCYATGNSGTAAFYFDAIADFCYVCQAIANTSPGFEYNNSANSQGGAMCVFCISANNTGSTTDGFLGSSGGDYGSIRCLGCVAYGNGRDGYRWACTSTSQPVIVDSVFVNNSGYGINNTVSACDLSAANLITLNNAFYGNTSGASQNWPTGPGDMTLTGSPFVNGASNNFALNNTSGAGASLRAAGFPGTPLAGGTGYLDIGALQHQATSSGGQHGSALLQ